VPEAYRDVQTILDRFVEINYETACNTGRLHTDDKGLSTDHINQQIIDVIRNNPPLATVPVYFRDGRENYLWYSDFYDDIAKDTLRQYGKFAVPVTPITPANYATELAKIDLPYFKELVNLVALEKMLGVAKANNPVERDEVDISTKTEPMPEPTQVDVGPEPQSKSGKRRLPSPTRSYESKMTDAQLSLLAEGLNTLGVFTNEITVPQLTDLLSGKQPRLFHVTNQRMLTNLFDELRDGGYITRTWIAVAGQNCDFASVNPRREDGGIHFITSQQFTNCRRANRSQAIPGFNTIDDMMEKMQRA